MKTAAVGLVVAAVVAAVVDIILPMAMLAQCTEHVLNSDKLVLLLY